VAVFAWVAANQAGVPIPAVPSLIGAGILAGAGHASLVTVAAVAVAGALVADLAWYGGRTLPRRAGARPDRQTLSAYGRARDDGQATVRGAPSGLPVHLPVPARGQSGRGRDGGAAHIAPGRYLAIVTASALVGTGTWIGTGYALGNAMLERPPALAS